MNMDKFTAKPKEIKVPICNECKHRMGGGKCKAFPEGIPNEIFNSFIDHRKPVEGDHGIQFESRRK